MNWLDESGSERRPLVFVEDHLYHTVDLLTAVREARPRLLDHVAVAVLDRPGPDTDAAVKSCATAFPEVAIVTPSASDIANTASFSKWVGRRMRPGGLLVQDVQLGTLPFIPADRWWESIYLAATIRGMFPDRPPAVRFLSNKRGYGATFGGEMLEAGFDPRDVMEKTDLAGTVTMGTTATGCVITFNVAYPFAPHCTVTWIATPLASQSYATSTTAITLTQTSASNNVAVYNCIAATS